MSFVRADGKTGSRFAMPIKLFGEPPETDHHVDGRAAGRFILSNARLLNVD